MERSVFSRLRPASSGGAAGFVAARKQWRRQQESGLAPDLRWTTRVVASAGNEALADGTPVWSLELTNTGGEASSATVVLFTADSVVRDTVGDGHVAPGARWQLLLDETPAYEGQPIKGYVLAEGSDGRWHAVTVDGRAASFRTEPDELGVRRTLGVGMAQHAAVGQEGRLWSTLVNPTE